MITLLASALLSCPDAAWIIQGIRESDLSQTVKSDLVLTVIEGTDPSCDLGAALEAELR